MCLFTSARTVAIVFARSAGSEAMYCAGVLTFDGGFMNSSSSRTKACLHYIVERPDRNSTKPPNFFRPLLRSFPRIGPDKRRNGNIGTRTNFSGLATLRQQSGAAVHLLHAPS